MQQLTYLKNVITKKDIVDKLKDMGVSSGAILEVHASLSSFGYVVGGAQSVIDALLEVIGVNGTLLMPIDMSQNSEPSNWKYPIVDINIIKKIRDNIPSFNKSSSDMYIKDELIDNLRRRKNVVISNNPTYPFIALGRYANVLCNHHSLHFPLSSESPIARIYELKGQCLLMGKDYRSCTCIHLSEYATDCRPIVVGGACVKNQNGYETWKKYLNLELNNSDFLNIGYSLEKLNRVKYSKIGNSEVRLFLVNDIVDEAVRYFENFSSYNFYR